MSSIKLRRTLSVSFKGLLDVLRGLEAKGELTNQLGAKWQRNCIKIDIIINLSLF